jgi:small-conductance mechanosensitive channel
VVWVGPALVLLPASTNAALLWALHDELIARDINIPFPQRDLYLKGGSLSVQLTGENPSSESGA